MASHKHKKQGKNILKKATDIREKPHGIYSQENDRLDYFISPDEANAAVETLSELLANVKARQAKRAARLFGTLEIQLLDP
jgi:hypothetical protein